MADSNRTEPSSKPPAVLNAMMTLFLKTPLIQNAIGKQLALLSFTGHRSGKLYTIPISYQRRGDSVFMMTKKSRSWWRNFADQPAVELRLAGKVVSGTAEAHVGSEQDLAEVVDFLTSRPRDAKAYGVVALTDGSPDPESVRGLLPGNVIVRVELD